MNDNGIDNPPINMSPKEGGTGGTMKEGVLFVLKIAAYIILPSIIYLVLLKLFSLLTGTTLKLIWEDATLIVSGIMPLPLLYASKSIGKVISKSWVLRAAFVFILSLVFAGYLYGTGKLFAWMGIIDI